jgi:hypothetical protein
LGGGVDRQALEQAGVLGGGEVIEQRVRQEQLAREVAVEVPRVDLLGAPDERVHLVEVALHDRGARDLEDLDRAG